MKIGDMLCPQHPDKTLFQCKPLHEAVSKEPGEKDEDATLPPEGSHWTQT